MSGLNDLAKKIQRRQEAFARQIAEEREEFQQQLLAAQQAAGVRASAQRQDFDTVRHHAAADFHNETAQLVTRR